MNTKFKGILGRLGKSEFTYDDMIRSMSDDEYQELKNLNFSAELLFLVEFGYLESFYRNSEIYYKLNGTRDKNLEALKQIEEGWAGVR